jgi:outer membrane protein assembly complex protein YaeT
LARSRNFRLALYGTGGLVALIALAIAALHTAPAKRFALRQAVGALRDSGIDFSASTLDYNLLTLRIELRNVKIGSRQTPDLPPIAAADRVSATLDWAELRHGAYYVGDAVIENPQVQVVMTADGRDNIPRPPSKPNSKPVDYGIRHLRISGGAVSFDDRKQQISARLPLDRITVDGRKVTLRAADGGELAAAGRRMPLRGVGADLLAGNDTVRVNSLTAQWGDSGISAQGTVENLDNPRLDLHGDATLALASFADPVRGTVRAAWTAKGPAAALQTTARVHGEGVRVDQFDRIALDAEAAYDVGASKLQIASLNVTSPLGHVTARGNAALHGESNLQFQAEGIDLRRWRIASRAAARGEARWPGLDYQQAAGDVNVRVESVSQVPAKDMVPVSAALRAQARGNRITVAIDDARALGASAAGELVLTDRKSLGGELRVDAPRLSSTVSQAEAYLGKPLIGTPVEGALHSTARLSGTVSAPAADVNLAIPALAAGSLEGISVNAAARYSPARVSIDDATVTWQNQGMHASGTIGLEPAQPMDLTVTAERVSIPALLAGLNRADIPVTGDLALAARVTGTLDAPQANVNLSGSGIDAYQEPLGNLQAHALLEGSQVRLNDFALAGLRASGAYNLDSKQYDFQAQAHGLQLSKLTLPDGTAVRATIDLDASGRGTADNPAADVRLVADGVKVGDRDFGRAELTVAAANREAHLQAAAPKFNATAGASVGTQAPYPADLQVRLSDTSLSDVSLDGSISAVINASGELQNYTKATASAEISRLDLKWNGEQIRTDGPMTARYANSKLTLDHVAVTANGARIEASGSMPLEQGDGAIRLKAQLNLPDVVRLVPSKPDITLQGTASIDGTIRGTLHRLDPSLAITLDDVAISTPTLTPAITGLTLHGQVRDGALELSNASAKWGDASFTATGAIPFALLPADLPFEIPRRQGPAKLTADLKGLNLAALPSVPANLTGAVSAHLEAETPKPELNAVRAIITFPELQAKLDTYAIAQDGTSEIALANGIVSVRRLHLTGPETELNLSGTAELAGKQALDLHLDGKLDASLASVFSSTLRARGATEIHAAVTGTTAEPEAKGYLQIADGQISIPDPRIGIDALNLRVDLDGTRATVSRLDGQVNGGTLGGGGSVTFRDGGLHDSSLAIRADDLYLDYPPGLKTVSDLRLQLKDIENRLLLRGTVLIKEGGFTDDLNFDTGILAAATAPRGLDLPEQRNSLMDTLRLNVSIVTQDPIVVENNLAKAELSAQLVVLGTPAQPGLAGRLVMEEGSQITLQERKYEITRGIITFTSDRRIEPNLDFEATTTASNYEITVQISGPPGDTKTQLTSNPDLGGQDNILALLVSGKTLDEIRGQEFQVAQTQMLSYLTGRVGGSLGRQVAKATGLSSVRVEPNLIAAETNPSARLTVGQDITRQLQLIYSMDLVNSSDQIYIAEYDLTKRFVTRGVRQSDGSFRFDFRHDVRFGGIAPPRRGKIETRRVGDVTITGESFFTQEKIRQMLKVKPGDRYDFFKVRRGMDRVSGLYTKAGMLESDVRLNRQQKQNTVDLHLRIDPGPRMEFVYEGADVPGGVRKNVRRVWSSGVFDSQRGEDAAGLLQAWLIRNRYLTPQVKPEITRPAEDRKHVVFEIQRGPRFEHVEWVFDGAAGISPDQLRGVIEGQKLSTEVYTKPARVTTLLTDFYHDMGYLDAVMGTPRYELDPNTRSGRVVFPVNEGPLYHVGEARFEGNAALTQDDLAKAVPMPKGDVYRPVLRENGIQRLRDAYWARGYNDVDAECALQRVPARGVVNLDFRITENARSMVREITIEGNRDTSTDMIRTQLDIKPGQPMDLQKLSNSRRKLYNTGAFSMVDINREEMKSDTAGDKSIRLRVRVREIQPFELRYGGFFDTERGPGGIVDFANRNSLGSARVLGFRGRYDSQLQEARLYFSQPLLTRFPLKTIASPYFTREINPGTDLVAGFNVDRIGFSVQQEAALGRKFLVNYGYRIERSHTYDTGPDPIFDVFLRLAALTSTVSRDTRDDLLDASKGSFLSQAFQFSPASLGSQVRFVKYFGQYFRYFPLQKPRVELFTNQVLRPRLVYATGIRVGLSHGLGGQDVPPSERFLAGGSTTVRGFEQNSLGSAGSLQLGGNAMLVLNNELRFPLFKMFDGVGFVDIGNVYPTISDFSLSDLRKAAGAGLRVRTPWFLLRLDYGFKLDRRPGESIGRIFFSIGQAF